MAANIPGGTGDQELGALILEALRFSMKVSDDLEISLKPFVYLQSESFQSLYIKIQTYESVDAVLLESQVGPVCNFLAEFSRYTSIQTLVRNGDLSRADYDSNAQKVDEYRQKILTKLGFDIAPGLIEEYENQEKLLGVKPFLESRLQEYDNQLQAKLTRLYRFSDLLGVSTGRYNSFRALLTKIEATCDEAEQYKVRLAATCGDVELYKAELAAQVAAVNEQGSQSVNELEAHLEGVTQQAKAELSNFKQQKDELLGQIEDIANRAMRRGVVAHHKDTAASEKRTANWLRRGALVLMLTSVGILAYSLYEFKEFNPSNHLQMAYRIVISLLFTVPAAYMARESSRHRQQQYRYHEIALNVNAVNPLIKDLEKSDQDKIRAQIASDLLSANGNNNGPAHPAADPFPVNINDVVMKILDKVDLKPASPAPQAPPAPQPSPASPDSATQKPTPPA